jgi:hypothetical protein
MRSQVNMMWNNMPYHHIILISPLDCGIINYIFVIACRDKFACHEKKKIKIPQFCQQKYFDIVSA